MEDQDGGTSYLREEFLPPTNPCYLNPTFDPSCLFQFYLSMSGGILDFAVEAFITVRRRRGNKSVRSIKMLSMQHVMVNS